MVSSSSEFEITRGNSRDVKQLFAWFGGSEQRITLFDDLYGGCPNKELNRKYTDGFLHKHKNRLEELGLITEHENGHRLTELGKLIYDSFVELSEYSALVSDIGPFLNAVENWEKVLPEVELLNHAEVIMEDEFDPTRAVDRYRDHIEDTNEIREIVCGIIDSNGFQEQVEEEGLTAECLYAPRISEYIATNDQRYEIAKNHQEIGAISHYKLDEDFPFSLTILDNMILVWTSRADAEGYMVMLESDAKQIRNWATELFEEKKSESTELKLNDDEAN
jgi:predicted transcriptional regulator